MSIRTFLTLVIAVMGVALLAVVGLRVFSDAARSARAHDVVALAKISQSLLPTLISSRIERRTAVVASMDAAPADAASWQRLAVHRPITDAMCAQSIAALRDIAAGETLTTDNIGTRRPASGMPPAQFAATLGRKAARSIPEGTLLTPDMLG